MKILFIPIDNRPVCYQLPKMIADISGNINLILPPIEFLGSLTKYANVDKLTEWLKENITGADKIILSLDTVAYGGLISSRRCPETFEEIKKRILTLKRILQSSNSQIFAFSSIMRISNNNINQEEKLYWKDYGEQIFRYSFEIDKFGKSDIKIPKDILNDYLITRKRNFEINKIYLEWQKEGLFDTLIFSKDDCAEFGLNVQEARELEKLGGYTKTGADEIPLTLLAGAINTDIKVCPIFLEPEYKNLISNYEDVSIEKSVLGQLELAKCNITDKDNADVLLYINNFKDFQGEIVMKRDTKLFDGKWLKPEKEYIIADVRNANGADNNFVKELFNAGFDEKFLGYAAWNTSANTLGSLICIMKVTMFAKRSGCFLPDKFKDLAILRFLDDWAYQANVRQMLTTPDTIEIKNKMQPFEEILSNIFGKRISAQYTFPWNRLFEVNIELN